MEKLSSRLKLLMENLLERRDDGWKDKLFSNEGPKRIAELHEEIKKELEEQYKSAMESRDKYPYDYKNNNTKYYQVKDTKQVRVQGKNQFFIFFFLNFDKNPLFCKITKFLKF